MVHNRKGIKIIDLQFERTKTVSKTPFRFYFVTSKHETLMMYGIIVKKKDTDIKYVEWDSKSTKELKHFNNKTIDEINKFILNKF